ncbi:hypothetical protein ACI65C_006167 [Semiaphis heraclei]
MTLARLAIGQTVICFCKDSCLTRDTASIQEKHFASFKTMASTSTSEVIVNEESDIWSVGKCVICNMQLTGEPKILSCLHIICKDCIGKKNSVSGVECKCLTVTKGKLIDYPIVSPNLNLSINKGHNINATMTYQMLEEFHECSSCKVTGADVYCTECSILLCQFCHLHSHHNHNYKILETFRKEINSNILLEKFKLKLNNNNLNLSLEETKKQIENLEIKKRSIHEEIDKETEIIHKEISNRALELKYLVDNCFIDTIGETHKNNQTLKDLQNKNNYYIEITKSVLNHNNLADILNVSRVVLTQLENVNNNTINVFEVTSKLGIDLQNNFDETMDNCISTIKEIGNIIALPVFSLPKTNGINTSNNVCHTIVNLQTQSVHPTCPFQFLEEDYEVNTSGYFNMDTENVDNGPLNYVECDCCRQSAEQLVKCVNCKRSYHNHCHIPLIPENIIHKVRWSPWSASASFRPVRFSLFCLSSLNFCLNSMSAVSGASQFAAKWPSSPHFRQHFERFGPEHVFGSCPNTKHL